MHAESINQYRAGRQDSSLAWYLIGYEHVRARRRLHPGCHSVLGLVLSEGPVMEPSVKTRLDATLFAKGLLLAVRPRTPAASISIQGCLPTLDP